METDEKFEKPIKPKLEDYHLDEQKVKMLNDYKAKCKKYSSLWLWIVFVTISVIGINFLKTTGPNYGYVVFFLFVSAITTWGIVPFLIKKIDENEISEIIFENSKNSTISKIDQNYNAYNSAMGVYEKCNEFYERVISRASWQYWLSLTPKDFEDAVGYLFLDKGYEVWTTSATGDHGVDLYLKKDGKKFVVQCKTHKKVLGPSTARDLYGTMISERADEGFLVAPSGFSSAAKEFCKDKPIKLMDIDDLTKMTYNYERYVPYWLDNIKSKEDFVKVLKKILRESKGRRY
jgi:HJR/Mrr/RecB family endonuclease